MRCKKHPADGSCGVGICASCLRERLLAVIAAQAQAEVIKQALYKSDSHLSFPRSVSPYISCRHHLFYSTPQVGPNVSVKDRKKSRFSSLFWGLFRSKSNKKDLDPTISNRSCSASPAWFSNIGRRKQKVPVEESVIVRATRHRGRGLSPDDGGSSGHSSDSHGWRHTPQRTRGRTAAHSSSLSGLTFCLSPLVRPSPNSHWNQKVAPPDVVATPKPHLSAAVSFCKNRSRSRKLVDFGRCPAE